MRHSHVSVLSGVFDSCHTTSGHTSFKVDVRHNEEATFFIPR